MLEVRDLSVRYGAVSALRDVSIEVEKGRIVAILGANGAGKTTLLRAICGLVKPVAGAIVLEGTRIDGTSPESIVRRGASLIPEGRGMFPELSVRENLQAGAFLRSAPERTKDYGEVMKMFPALAKRQSQIAVSLSGGEQQMVAIGRAFMARPKLLLADEISLGLAPAITRLVFERLVDLRSQGITLVIVEQNAHLALAAADYAYVLKRGRVVAHGEARTLASQSELAEAYLGV